MVTKITVPHSIQRALHYNEQKVAKGVAECVYAANFLKEPQELDFYEKLAFFQDLIGLNKRAATNSVHVSVNFSNQDQLDREGLIQIAQSFMERIGFGRQPYLVYQHHDSGHPHLHVVTTNIQRDGKRISLHNLGRNQAAAARKEIEKAFHLVPTGAGLQKGQEPLQPVHAIKAQYGKMETKAALTSVLREVVHQYKYTTLAELNAVLRSYNVLADPGKEGGRIWRNKGLTYRLLDEEGKKIGVPIKASSLAFKATLSYLETRFLENRLLRLPHQQRLMTAIDWSLRKPHRSLSELAKALSQEKVSLVVRRDKGGGVHGLTYIDHQTKCVFNGSDLGKAYSAQGVLERCQRAPLSPTPSTAQHKVQTAWSQQDMPAFQKERTQALHTHEKGLIDVLLTPEKNYDYLPHELKKPKKKKRTAQHVN